MSVAGKLRQNTALAIEEIVGITPQFSTSGGVSDARFIAATGAEVIELGPINQSIHQINEHVSLKDLETLTHLYATLLKKDIDITSDYDPVIINKQKKKPL
ncbi:M20/M25/M40 family metallo-hydrolase [Rickettsiella massiliensis]|uniref:M20/M25/M40 family metallo-hydrolase n=1 Tax=Rickettsiella massiliensis TaxID=676517 RepID=UPI000299D9AD|nr:M20/M25/M40 family metallo-hydrolase [Rickettsiella massiliensis]